MGLARNIPRCFFLVVVAAGGTADIDFADTRVRAGASASTAFDKKMVGITRPAREVAGNSIAFASFGFPET